MGGQGNAGGFYPHYVELEMENRLYNRQGVFGTKTSKRGARVRRTDSLLGFTGQTYPALTHTNFEG